MRLVSILLGALLLGACSTYGGYDGYGYGARGQYCGYNPCAGGPEGLSPGIQKHRYGLYNTTSPSGYGHNRLRDRRYDYGDLEGYSRDQQRYDYEPPRSQRQVRDRPERNGRCPYHSYSSQARRHC